MDAPPQAFALSWICLMTPRILFANSASFSSALVPGREVPVIYLGFGFPVLIFKSGTERSGKGIHSLGHMKARAGLWHLWSSA